MRRKSVPVLTPLLILLLTPSPAASQQKHPVYVGAKVCAGCHDGHGTGDQYSRWMLAKHARAWAALSTPEARAMAALSGIPGEPQEAAVCLGCHATASDAEEWEKDPTFALEDGIQCERCHGPGSEYIAEGVMRDREAAMKAGLRMPTKGDCVRCHYVKGSHVAVHHLPQLDIDEALQRIAHPIPAGGARATPLASPPATGPGASSEAPRYTGSRACGACHRGPAMGYQLSAWRLGPHARAWAVLATPEAARRAAEQGIEGDPRTSPQCLRCHATGYGRQASGSMEGFSPTEGVGCEACHGPGSVYSHEAIMRDPRAAATAGLKPAGPATCVPCHENAHGKPFDPGVAMAAIAHPARRPPSADAVVYKTPVNLAFTPDGSEAWVACEASGTVVVVDARDHNVVAEIPVGGQPNDVAFGPHGRRAYVSNRLDDTVSVLDVASRQVTDTIAVGDEPHGLLADRDGRYLYVLNTSADSISVVDLSSLATVRVLSASRNPWSLALSPDGTRLVVSNNLSRFVGFREAPVSELTVLDAEQGVVEDRADVDQANLLQGIAWHPSGAFALFTLNRTKNLVPMTRILQGWTITNGIGVLWKDGRVDQLLLDEPNAYFPDTADIAVTPDGSKALVTSSGSDQVAVVDVARMLALLEGATEERRRRVLPNHLGTAAQIVLAHVPVKNSPRGIAVNPGGTEAWVANALDDSLSVIDLDSLRATRRIDLGGPAEITPVRRGERLFHSARIAFQRQFSCHSCHPDGHVDGITYDIEPDGIGLNPVDNRTLRGILDTDPFKWTGLNPSLRRQCGPRLSVFFTRIQPFDPDELTDVESYIRTIPRPPNRYRAVGAPLTPAQRRGKGMFERTTTNDGRVIPEDLRCVTCHFPPLFTDRTKRDVGTQMALDTHDTFDVPHLNNIYDSAPYLHNGIAATLEEIWTRYNPRDRHGVTNDMTKDQLNDLIEYLRTL